MPDPALSPSVLAEGRRLLGEATEGPWYWGGYSDGSIDLRAAASMTPIVLSAMRSIPCVVTLADGSWAVTADACDACIAESKETHDPFVDYSKCDRAVDTAGTLWLRDPEAGFMRPANEWAEQEVEYRADVKAVAHPDAALICWLRNHAEALLNAAEGRGSDDG